MMNVIMDDINKSDEKAGEDIQVDDGDVENNKSFS